MLFGVPLTLVSDVGGPEGAEGECQLVRKSTKGQLSPASSVNTEIELLTGLLPNILKALTVIVYLFPGSSPVIV